MRRKPHSPILTVLIASRGEPDILAGCLRSLYTQTIRELTEILVVSENDPEALSLILADVARPVAACRGTSAPPRFICRPVAGVTGHRPRCSSVAHSRCAPSSRLGDCRGPTDGKPANEAWRSTSVGGPFTLRVVKNPGAGVGAAWRHGANLALGDYVALLDDDCRLKRSDHLELLVARFSDDNAMQALGGYYASSVSGSFASRLYNDMCNLWLESHAVRGPGGELRPAGVLLGGNSALRRTTLRSMQAAIPDGWRYGGTDGTFFAALAASSPRSVLVAADLTVEHDPGLTPRGLVGKAIAHALVPSGRRRGGASACAIPAALARGYPRFGTAIYVLVPYLMLHFLAVQAVRLSARWCQWESFS